MAAQTKQNEHISGALLAFILLIFIPIFLSNMIFVFNPALAGDGWKNFSVVLMINLVLIWSYSAGLKDAEHRAEKIFYSVLLFLMTAGILAIVISKLML